MTKGGEREQPRDMSLDWQEGLDRCVVCFFPFPILPPHPPLPLLLKWQTVAVNKSRINDPQHKRFPMAGQDQPYPHLWYGHTCESYQNDQLASTLGE